MSKRFVALLVVVLAYSTAAVAVDAQRLASRSNGRAEPRVIGTWRPPGKQQQIAIWPGAIPDTNPDAKPESTDASGGAFNVRVPTMTIYPVKEHSTGTTVVVFPGGGYQALAMSGEGTDVCDWLNSRGIACVLLKYRVPDSGPTMKNGRTFYPEVQTALQDAQRTIGLVRQRAHEWKIDPHKVGVIGFSAGGHLAAAVSTHFAQRTYPPVDAADELSSRPDFAIIVYPGPSVDAGNRSGPAFRHPCSSRRATHLSAAS